MKLSPMMEQWRSAKEQHADAILLFRMGDFYELFGEDAVNAAPVLDLTLTSRDKDRSGLKMAGFPAHAAENYIQKLLELGHKVAVCEQLENPKHSKGIVKRGITEVISPGTRMGLEHEHNYLLSLYSNGNHSALAAIDLSTAHFLVTKSDQSDKILEEISRINPKEIIVLRDDKRSLDLIYSFEARLKDRAKPRIEKKDKFFIASLAGQAFDSTIFSPEQQIALSLITAYVKDLRGDIPKHIGLPAHYSIDARLLIDEATRENLDLFPQKKGEQFNLYSLLNENKTAMGKRLLSREILAAPTDIGEIEKRHTIVDDLLKNGAMRSFIRDELNRFHDIEKLSSLLVAQKIGPRALRSIAQCLQVVARLKEQIKSAHVLKVYDIIAQLPDLTNIKNSIDDALLEDAPHSLKDGPIFKRGFNKKLDELLELAEDSQSTLLNMEIREREESGIASLKIRYTRVFGYYIEITKSHLVKVPSHYQRKQTVANGERFVTKELSELEYKITMAKEESAEQEISLFEELRESVAKSAADLIKIGKIIAVLDMLTGFAELASLRDWVRPNMLEKEACISEICAGRHPIVEELTKKDGSYFVANDLFLDSKETQVLLVSGPNMAGKSTIMRQAALIQIMAQLGSFVPAKSAKLSICESVFARVGASDDIASGRSTFMVEMTELAHILSSATPYSLVLLDEIGRGTSTYDGMSIAQAVIEYIHENIGARTIFATHYHELCKLSSNLSRLKNMHVEVDECNGKIRFLYTLKEGPALKSFGIHVAERANLPERVIERAYQILASFEDEKPSPPVQADPIKSAGQLFLFAGEKNLESESSMNETIKRLLALDINRLSPLAALNKLATFQSSLRALQGKDQGKKSAY
jgi:DNA mismatch repair protein MutS